MGALWETRELKFSNCCWFCSITHQKGSFWAWVTPPSAYQHLPPYTLEIIFQISLRDLLTLEGFVSLWWTWTSGGSCGHCWRLFQFPSKNISWGNKGNAVYKMPEAGGCYTDVTAYSSSACFMTLLSWELGNLLWTDSPCPQKPWKARGRGWCVRWEPPCQHHSMGTSFQCLVPS